ncbi:Uncharacterised protein [Escherichia coli]|nr:Uncharacterised protein [Escherichia coli]
MMIQSHPLLAAPLAVGDTIGFFSSSAPATVTAKIVFFGELSFFRERDLSWYQGSLPVKQIFIVQVLLKKELKNLMS